MIAIVVDSTAYFTKREAKDMGINIVPLIYSVKGVSYLESYVDESGDYERLIDRCGGDCNTYQRNTHMYAQIFERLVGAGHEVLCITISSRLSGAFSSARLAAKKSGRGRVKVFDSLSGAGGLYILAKKAAALSRAGMGMDRIMESLRCDIPRLHVAFSVDDMSQLKKGGRLGNVPQYAPILNNKPFFKLADGAIVFDKMSKGTAERVRHLVDSVPEGTKRVIVHYNGSGDTAEKVCREISRTRPEVPVELRRLGPVLSVHLGLGCIVVTSEQ